MEYSSTLKSKKAGLNPKFQIKHKISILKSKLLDMAVFLDVSKIARTSNVTFATMAPICLNVCLATRFTKLLFYIINPNSKQKVS